ncbi:transglutaminase domain-containing protein [Anaeromicropila herbilytica]|uniref:Transglutaminase-like domain-containing protein n=1 Tax=Anaeromicropila herbilytica TaxID=2785025 RepID=A0A7R7IF79_9FIRM|nr:transglutaminase domain-containing protein [Anaeromicropila herbilytica]BCN32899.1 hypothetical protein bsdtb5_41940 [Anaeromicropila herbilytica]
MKKHLEKAIIILLIITIILPGFNARKAHAETNNEYYIFLDGHYCNNIRAIKYNNTVYIDLASIYKFLYYSENEKWIDKKDIGCDYSIIKTKPYKAELAISPNKISDAFSLIDFTEGKKEYTIKCDDSTIPTRKYKADRPPVVIGEGEDAIFYVPAKSLDKLLYYKSFSKEETKKYLGVEGNIIAFSDQMKINSISKAVKCGSTYSERNKNIVNATKLSINLWEHSDDKEDGDSYRYGYVEYNNIKSIDITRSYTRDHKTEKIMSQQEQLDLVGTSQKPTWTSSDSSILQISNNGEIIPINFGSAVVTATISNRSVSCTVNVCPDGLNSATLAKKTFGLTDESLETYNIIQEFVNNNITSSMSDTDKVNIVLDWFINNKQYDDTLQKYSPLEAIVGKEAVCADYALAFRLFMNMLDIPCYYVEGYSKDKPDVGHAWNCVYVNNKYYYVDATWSSASKKYFSETLWTDHMEYTEVNYFDEAHGFGGK